MNISEIDIFVSLRSPKYAEHDKPFTFYSGREGKTECSLYGDECENVSHVLWECSAYSSTRACFIKKLQELLEDEYEDFESLDKVEKSSYVLGSELWESKFDGLLSLVKEYIIDVWEIRKHKLYDSDSGPSQQLHSRFSEEW